MDTSLPVFDYDHDSGPVIPTPSVTDYESSDSECDVDTHNKAGQRVLNLTPRNQDRDYSVLDDFFNQNPPLISNIMNSDDDSINEKNDNENKMRIRTATKVEDCEKYVVSDHESLNTIALKFNISRNMLKQLNALTSDLIFPGQSILVPKHLKPAVIDSTEPSLLQVAEKVELPPKRSIFKYPMKRITRFEGSVAGTTLMTSNAFMFRAHVSDKLVIQNGQSSYNVSIPLDSISEVLMFESFDQMLANIQSTTGVENACEKCADVKYQLWHDSPTPSGEENLQMMNTSSDDEQGSEPPTVEIVTPYPLSRLTSSDNASPLSPPSGEIELGQSPDDRTPLYSPTCDHEFEGFASRRYSVSNRVNPFSIGDEHTKILIPPYKSSIDPLINNESYNDITNRIHRTDSDTSIATKAFFQKIDDNTNQMQSLLDTVNSHEYSVFISLHAFCCSRTHGKPSYQFETEDGYSKAHFWVCVPESDVSELMENFKNLCPQLVQVDDSTNCIMKCDEDYWRSLTDAILPDRKPQFVPREIDEDLMSEPFSGNLNYPSGKTVLLTEDMMSQLQPYLPCHIIGIDMMLAYSMRIHGMSLRSLYKMCEPYSDLPCILLIKDTQHYVFGAYLSEGIVESHKYYGSGESFLFRLTPDPECYFWQGSNHYFMMGTNDYFTVGAGDGNFALYFDEMLEKGTSNRSLTFHNEVLSSKSSFNILTVEVWCFTDETLEEGDDISVTSDKSRLSGQYRGSFYNIR